MPDWKTRLAVTYTDQDGNQVDVTQIDSFTPSFTLNAEAVHSLAQTHIGVSYSPDTMSFTMTVKAIGPVAGQLTALALQGKRFDVTLHENNGDDWSFKTVVMSDCIITSATPTAATISGAPSATFSGFSLQATVDPKVGQKTTIGHP